MTLYVQLYGGSGDTPLHFSGRASIGYNDSSLGVRTECMEILIAHSANVDSQNDAGRTPLHAAVATSEFLCVQVLVKHGARVDLKDNDGKTALMLAQNMGAKNKEIIYFLVEQHE